MILRQTWKGLCNLSHAPSGAPKAAQSYRTGFARACWAVGGLFIYFLIHFLVLSGSGEGSVDNNGIYLLLMGATIAAGIGAFFAPRINAYLYQFTPQGRRRIKAKKQLSLKKGVNSSSSSRSSRSGQRNSSKSSSGQSSKTTAD